MIVAVVRRAFQPIDTLGGIVNVGIIGEIQLSEGVLCRVQVLLGRAFQQLLRFDCVRYQQPTVTVRRADDVLGVGVTLLRKLFQLLCRLVSLCQRKALIIRYALQILTFIAHAVGTDLFAVILHFLVLEGKSVHADMLRFFDDGVLDLAEFLLLRQRRTQPFLSLGVVILHLTLQFPPCLVARIHSRQPRHLVDDLVHQLFHWLRQIAVGFLAADLTELPRQIPDHLFRLRVDAGHFPHGLRQFQHGFSCFRHQFVSRFVFLLIDVQQLLSEDLIGQRGLDLAYPIFGQVRLIGFHRPRHHVDMRMIALIVEGGVPAEVLRRDLHRCGDVVAVGAEQCAPCVRVIIPKPLCVLLVEGDDVRPHVAGVVIQFVRDSGEVNGIVISEETVFPQPLRSRTQSDVLGVALHRGEPVPIRFQRQRDERGRGCFCRV